MSFAAAHLFTFILSECSVFLLFYVPLQKTQSALISQLSQA